MCLRKKTGIATKAPKHQSAQKNIPCYFVSSWLKKTLRLCVSAR